MLSLRSKPISCARPSRSCRRSWPRRCTCSSSFVKLSRLRCAGQRRSHTGTGRALTVAPEVRQPRAVWLCRRQRIVAIVRRNVNDAQEHVEETERLYNVNPISKLLSSFRVPVPFRVRTARSRGESAPADASRPCALGAPRPPSQTAAKGAPTPDRAQDARVHELLHLRDRQALQRPQHRRRRKRGRDRRIRCRGAIIIRVARLPLRCPRVVFFFGYFFGHVSVLCDIGDHGGCAACAYALVQKGGAVGRLDKKKGMCESMTKCSHSAQALHGGRTLPCQ